MIRGVKFKIPQKCGKSLWQILSCIDIAKYDWHYIESQSEICGAKWGTEFFDKEIYDGQSFSKQIQNEHYIVFLKLQAYFKGESYCEIHSYSDFVKNDCQIVVLIDDCEFVDIYLKDNELCKKLYENALKNNFADIDYITDEKDERKRFDVL